MTAIAHHPHRVTRAVAGMRATCADLADLPLWSMGGPEAAQTLTELVALEAQLAELKARTLTRVEQADLPNDSGATSTANWLAHHTKTTRPAAHRQTRLATGLENHDQTRDALATGRVHEEQAEVIL